MKKMRNEKMGNRIHTLGSFHFYMAKKEMKCGCGGYNIYCDSAGSLKKLVITTTIDSERGR